MATSGFALLSFPALGLGSSAVTSAGGSKTTGVSSIFTWRDPRITPSAAFRMDNTFLAFGGVASASASTASASFGFSG